MESLRMKEKLMGNLFAAEEEEKQEKGGSTGRVLKSSLAHEAADLSDVLQFYPVRCRVATLLTM